MISMKAYLLCEREKHELSPNVYMVFLNMLENDKNTITMDKSTIVS